MATSLTLRAVIDAGASSKRLDELSSARVIGKIALQAHAAQQKAGAGKAIGPITPALIALAPSGEATLELADVSSFGYSSPEQVAGSAGDRRSDVFSLGTVMWEALTHQRLFDAMNDAAVKIAVQERPIQAPAELNANVPAELSAICMRALSRNPADRYQSLKAMAVEIEEFLEEAGYADDDSKIAAYLAAIGTAVPAKRSPLAPSGPTANTPPATQAAPLTPMPPTLPTPTPPPATQAASPAKSGSGTQPPPMTLRPAAAQPSILVDKLAEPRPKTPSGAAIAAALANAGKPSSVESATAKETIATSVPPQVKVATTIDAQHAEAKQPAVIVDEVPPAFDPRATLIGPAVAPPARDTTPPLEAKPLVAPTAVEVKPTTFDAKPAEVKPASEAAPIDVTPAVSDAKATDVTPAVSDAKATDVTPAATEAKTVEVKSTASDDKPTVEVKRLANDTPSTDAAPAAPAAATESKPNPAEVVSLPMPAGRESKDVLAGWGWGTGKHDAIAPADYGDADDVYEQPSSRKPLVYVIGGGLAVALLITIVAFAAGGSNDKKKQPANAAQQVAADATNARAIANEAPAAVEAPTTPPAAPEMSEAERAALAKQEAERAEAAKAEAAKAEAEAAKAEAARAEAAKAEAARAEAERAKSEAERAALAKAEAKRLEAEAKQAEAEAKKAEQARLVAARAEAKRIEAEKAEARRAEAKRIEAEKAEARRAAREAKKAEAAKAAAAKAEAKKAEAAKTTTIAKTDSNRPKQVAKAEPKTVAKAEPKTTGKTEAKTDGKLDVETAYRIGLQQFARGDTTGALASLRTSLAANPNYAPTWRGLGLVFEKMGEKDQARAAYKRYLQLAPSAGDADFIRGRLERLGS